MGKGNDFGVGNYHDIRARARRRLPRFLFEYVDRGAEDELSLAANRAAFERVKLRHRVMVDVSRREQKVTLFGREAAMPLAKRWPRTLMVKGVMTVEDAQLAAEHGADAVVISNHGGRNLDAAPATLDVLPSIAQAVGSRMTVIVDSGVRRGSDVVKAMALGAKAVLVGRPTLFGVGMGGAAGASRALDILRSEIDTTQGFIGCPRLADIDASVLHR